MTKRTSLKRCSAPTPPKNSNPTSFDLMKNPSHAKENWPAPITATPQSSWHQSTPLITLSQFKKALYENQASMKTSPSRFSLKAHEMKVSCQTFKTDFPSRWSITPSLMKISMKAFIRLRVSKTSKQRLLKILICKHLRPRNLRCNRLLRGSPIRVISIYLIRQESRMGSEWNWLLVRLARIIFSRIRVREGRERKEWWVKVKHQHDLTIKKILALLDSHHTKEFPLTKIHELTLTSWRKL